MSAAHNRPIGRPLARRGFSLVETAISTAIAGLVLVVALRAAGSAVSSQAGSATRSQACQLTRALMTEILDCAYEDPEAPGSLGPEAGEDERADYDDVDDYDGWSISKAGWDRSVSVEYVEPDDLAAVAGSDLGVKRVTVSIARDGQTQCVLTSILTRSWQPPPYE